jgi:uncharacterized protein YkuJ
MIKIKIEECEMDVPTDCSEIKLSSYIEFNLHHAKFLEIYNASGGVDYAASEAVKALSCVIEGFTEEVAYKLTVGEYNPSDKAKTINELMYLVNATITNYSCPDLTDSGYGFDYKGKRWLVPIVKYYDGRINPYLTYGQFIEVSETIRVQNIEEVKTPNQEFAEFLRVLSSVVREEGYFREETALSLRMMTDENMNYFQDIDMKSGLDVYFFLNGTIRF